MDTEILIKLLRKPLISPKTLEAIGIKSMQSLANDRWKNIGLPYIRIGRTIRYKRSDIVKYLRKHYHVPAKTSESA